MKIFRIVANVFYAVMLPVFGFTEVQAGELLFPRYANTEVFTRQDTIPESSKKDTASNVNNLAVLKGTKDALIIRTAALNPNLSLQQMLKGNVSGVYVQETNGEPGTEQSMLIRGLSSPIFSRRDIHGVQPVVYLNGIPLIQDNPFAFDIQKYDYNRIGPATNLLAAIDINNINSIEVIKDPVELSRLGPNAANGAIWVTTKNAHSGFRQISLNSYFGIVQGSNVSTINGAYETKFRQPFYQKYATAADRANYASYLRDSTSTDYYGPSNWSDLYYKDTPVYAIDLSLTGGSERANFRFFGSATRGAGNADATGLDRYNASFQINMAPFKWLTISSMVNAVRLDRDRNRSLRDRFAETRYLTDFSTPLVPNKIGYQTFLDEYDKVVDDNLNNIIQGYLSLKFKLNKVNFTSSLQFDYNEGLRDVFFPSTLMEGNNFVSNYFGYNQRMVLNNAFTYDYELNRDHHFDFELGQSIQSDMNKYNYATAYKGPNDFIKINEVVGDASKDDYLVTNGAYVFRYADRERSKLFSVYGTAKYRYKDLLSVRATVRNDGTSNGQPDSRWLITPAISASWSMKNQFLKENLFFHDLNIHGSWARSGKLFLDDRFAAGPQYRVEIGWNEEPTIPGYDAQSGISRPYNSGWVGYGIKQPYTDQLNLGFDAALLKGRLKAELTLYNKDDKRMLLNLPVSTESGYKSVYQSGMWVNNKGIDVALTGVIYEKQNSLSWSSGINFSFNRNELKALPDGLSELIIGDRKLKVGHAIDEFWLYQNRGIYNSTAEISVNPANNKQVTFDGNTLNTGDPKWVDQNGDYVVNDEDKVLTGHRLPALTGGWFNEFTYGNFRLNFHVFAAIGQKAINQSDASRYDFINRENSNSIVSIREITSWQINSEAKSYPIYNPWSNIIPYRIDQDLFLENASYVKLRSVSLGYEFSKAKFFTKAGFNRIYLYATANNLLTLSPFSGGDPELIDYMGMYNGYSMAIPKTITLGVKVDL